MNCPKCGEFNDEGSAFCFNCGNKLEAQQPVVQNSNQQPVQQANTQNQGPVQPQVIINNNSAGMMPGMVYEVSGTNRTLRMVAFILCLLRTIFVGWTLIPLAWHIPMTVHTWGIYKGRKANTVGYGVCTLLFCSLVAGILLLCARHDEKPSGIN